MRIKKNRKGEFGLGSLIIFISMILVVAISAGVIVATSTKTQNKALNTGKEGISSTGTTFEIKKVYGKKTADSNNIRGMCVITKIPPGSDSIRFEDMLVTMELKDQYEDYDYLTTVS